MMAGLFESSSSPPHQQANFPSVAVVPSDEGFVDLIRAGVLALQLLPRHSSAGLVLNTDGATDMPNVEACDALLNQLRVKAITLSVLLVTGAQSPDISLSRLSYLDLLRFMARNTYGVFLEAVPKISSTDYFYEINVYHQAFLCWSFKRVLHGVYLSSSLLRELEGSVDCGSCCSQGMNKFFSKTKEEFKLRRMLTKEVSSSLHSLLSCRLREGFAVNDVIIKRNKGIIEVKLTLPWKISSLIHYCIQTDWPLISSGPHKCQVCVFLEGDYDLIHDIFCQKGSAFQSKERNSVVKKFYSIIQHLSLVDRLLAHLESFSNAPSHFTVPESIANGVPLFQLSFTGTATPELVMTLDCGSVGFSSFWRPICSLDTSIWHRWMHTHPLHLILAHDLPLPKHLFSPNSSGRFAPVQCRKAMFQLSNMLKEVSSFVLVENTCYIKLLHEYEGGVATAEPSSFYIIRLVPKLPCLLIWLAFPGGVCGRLRQRELRALKERIERLVVKQHVVWSSSAVPLQSDLAAVSGDPSDLPACKLLSKPMEKILVRYETVPRDFNLVLESIVMRSSSRSQSPFPVLKSGKANPLTSGPSWTILNLMRYLCHTRWIWSVSSQRAVTSHSVVARILNILSKIRLMQGFNFARSLNGMQTMAIELPMKSSGHPDAEGEQNQSVLIQYVLFPSNSLSSALPVASDSSLEDINDPAAEGTEDIQIVTEVWAEPQDGVIVGEDGKDFFGARHKDISGIIFRRDNEVVNAFLTIEVRTNNEASLGHTSMLHQC
jgi:hypothetical protein